MTHMKFERKENKKREKETLKTFCNHFELTFAKHPEYAHIDAVLYSKGKITGFAEVKGVHKSIEKAYDVIVSMRKMVRAQKLQVNSGKPVVIIWAFNDGIVYERINNLKGIFYYGGRKERIGSTYDQEMLIKVLVKNLIRIEKDN
jgi:ADP-heptose:LPS heptosyltransferase